MAYSTGLCQDRVLLLTCHDLSPLSYQKRGSSGTVFHHDITLLHCALACRASASRHPGGVFHGARLRQSGRVYAQGRQIILRWYVSEAPELRDWLRAERQFATRMHITSRVSVGISNPSPKTTFQASWVQYCSLQHTILGYRVQLDSRR